MPSPPLWLIPLVLGTAWGAVLSYCDLRWRILPNWLTLGGAALALVVRLGLGGWPLFLDGVAAAAGAGAFLLVPFLLHGAGGGDVKMMFAAGAITGWSALLPLLWYTSLAGVVFGLLMLTAGRLDGARLKHLVRSVFDWRYDRKAAAVGLPPKDSERVRIPFSIPIAIGMAVALVV